MLHIASSEVDVITGGQLIFSTPNELVLSGFSPDAATTVGITLDSPTLTIQGKTEFEYAGALNFANSTAVSISEIDITAASITMGTESSITSTNHQIDLTASTGDVLLGLVDAGSANVNINADIGSVLNNNGVFADVTQSKTNIKANSTTIISNQRIGVSSTDAITIDASPSGLITLDFNADKAFINNLNNTKFQIWVRGMLLLV